MRVAARLAQVVGCAALGVLVSAAAVLLHGLWWGLPLGLLTTAAVLVALPAGWCRLPFALGWGLTLAVLAPSRPEGDYLVAGDLPGYTLLAAGVGVLLAGFVGLRPHTSRAARADEDAGGVARPT